MGLIESIADNEGFSPTVYKDHLGYDTIGYGSKMPITKAEGKLLLKHRLDAMTRELTNKIPWIDALPASVRDVLLEMNYQMGTAGLMKFKKMLGYLLKSDYIRAAEEGLDSRWAKQTPNRAERLMSKMSGARR